MVCDLKRKGQKSIYCVFFRIMYIGGHMYLCTMTHILYNVKNVWNTYTIIDYII